MPKIARFCYSVGYLGFVPWAPGTWGAAAAIVTYFGLLKYGLINPYILVAIILLSCIVALWSYGAAVRELNTGDPSEFVIDEYAGMMVSLLCMPEEWWLILASFLFFRLYDIWKPGPVGWLDRKHGAVPVLADDLLAGVMAVFSVWLVKSYAISV